MTKNSTWRRPLNTDQYTMVVIAELRRKHMPGSQIGEIVAEIEAYVEESGETVQEAFGDPSQYAKSRLGDQRFTGRWGRIGRAPAIVVGAVGGYLLPTGYAAGLSGTEVWGVGGWWVLLIGALLWFGDLCFIPVDGIVDPRRGGTRFGRASVIGWAAVTATVALTLITIVHLLTN